MPASAFDEVQFPTDISEGSVGGPEFSTEVVELGSGHERRNQNWTYGRERWNVAYGVKHKNQLITLVAFFHARRGRARGFRFKSHDDYSATAQELELVEGTDDQFQLVKHYGPLAYEYVRKVTKPVVGSVAVYVDGVPQGSGWTVDTTTGVVTFAVAPASGSTVTADFEFDIPARFDTDHLPVNFDTYEARSADVPVVEIKL